MSILKNLFNTFVPVREARRTVGNMAAVNAEVVHEVNGDESALIYLNGTGTLNATYNVQGSVDGINYFDLLCFPLSGAGGTIPQAGQPLTSEAVNVATVQRALALACGGLQRIRVRLTAYTSGTCAVTINSDACASISPYVRDQRAATLMVSATAASGAILTATLPAVTGLRHYIDRISVVRSLAAAQTATATPVVVTSTNIPGSLALTFGTDAGALGADREVVIDFGGAGMASTNAGVATTVNCPVTAGVIWRVNISYRLGL